MWEGFGEAMGQDFQSVPKEVWHTLQQLIRGNLNTAYVVFNTGGELLTLTECIVQRWTEYFNDLFILRRQRWATVGWTLSSLGSREPVLSNNSAAVVSRGWMRLSNIARTSGTVLLK